MCWGQAARSLILVPKFRLTQAPEDDIVDEVVMMWYREGGREELKGGNAWELGPCLLGVDARHDL